MNLSTDFPGNAFVSRQYPPPLTAPVVAQPEPQPEPEAGDVDSREAAEMIGITENNFRQMVHLKKLLPIGKRGRRNLFSRADVERIRDARRK